MGSVIISISAEHPQLITTMNSVSRFSEVMKMYVVQRIQYDALSLPEHDR